MRIPVHCTTRLSVRVIEKVCKYYILIMIYNNIGEKTLFSVFLKTFFFCFFFHTFPDWTEERRLRGLEIYNLIVHPYIPVPSVHYKIKTLHVFYETRCEYHTIVTFSIIINNNNNIF